MMHHHHHQGQFIPFTPQFSTQKRRNPSRHDGLFRLPTVLAQNDPFLRRLYSVVSLVLDDHPYPATPEQFEKRTLEIKKNVKNLNLSPDQNSFLRRLIKETGVSLVDLWQGSHVITLDKGYLYDTWSKSPTAHPRFSSHYRRIPLQQYGINFQDHQLLFGKTDIDGSTWFQMEAHGFEPEDIFNNPDLFVFHGQDFLKYRIHHMNVGPFGFSPHTEMMDPIIVPYEPIKLQTKQKEKPRRADRSIRSFFRI